MMPRAATRATPAPAVAPLDLDLAMVIERQRKRAREREFRPLGVLEKVQLEASGIARLAGNPLAGNRHRSASLDWYKTGALIGLSLDEREILVCSPLAAPPKIPDPAHQPSVVYDAEGRAIHGPMPMVEQDLRDVAAGVMHINGQSWIVLQPVHQALLIVTGKGFRHLNFSADAAGRHCCLLFDPERREGHFLYGRFEVQTYE